ncbi:MAG: LPS export ABC transporter periplasmic protein LptC [Lentisphaeraceae bacterium]|nr:LPS export ABC transporter periplasmic protein LptC [Lentisphaeraceae bacterium]
MFKYLLFLTSFSLLSQQITFKGVSLPNFSEKGQLESVVNCQRAERIGNIVEMEKVEIDVFDDQKTKLRTEKCVFQQYKKKLSGKEKVFLNNSQIDLEGQGFDYDLVKKELTIENDVTIYLNPPKGEQK